MTPKQFFLQVKIAERELSLLRARIRHYQDIGLSITGGTMDSPVVSHGRGSSRVEIAAMGIFDATRALEEQAKDYIKLIRKAENLIAQIPQERYRQILTLRYLCGWTYRSIADELRYKDRNSIYRAHGYALQAAQEIMDREME